MEFNHPTTVLYTQLKGPTSGQRESAISIIKHQHISIGISNSTSLPSQSSISLIQLQIAIHINIVLPKFPNKG